MFRVESNNPYNILEIPQNADSKMVRDAYRRLALKYHPDRNPPENKEFNTKKFQEISEAYENLSNISRQKGSIDVNGIFKNFFGSLYRSSKEDPNAYLHIYQELELSLEDVYKGRNVTIHYERQAPNDFCGMCQGSGFVIEDDLQRMCESCNGRGRERILQSCSVDIVIPPGFSETALFFQGKGHVDFMGNTGDLLVNVLYKPHEIFTQKGNDLFMDVDISFKDSLLGIELEIEYLDGTTREIPIDRPVRSGTLLKIKGLGINPSGDLFIKINIEDFPKELTPKQRKVIEKYF